MKRILAIARRDLKSGLRDYMVLYILVAPIFLALLLKAFIPTAGAVVIHAAVVKGADPAFIERLEQHGRVEQLASRDELIRRVAAKDDVIGLVETSDGFELIAGGNESEGSVELVEAVVDQWVNRDLELPATVTVEDVGWLLSPLMRYGANFLIVFVSVFGGMIVMLNLVEEKQANTLAAINVTAIRRWEYIAGKGLIGFVLPVVHAFAILLLLGFTDLQAGMVVLVVLTIALISLIIGFGIGIHSDNQMSAVSSMKMGFIPVFGSLFGAIFLDEKWHPLLYWSPFYWAFQSMDAIILKQAEWLEIIRNSSIIVALTALVFLLMLKRIKRGFTSV